MDLLEQAEWLGRGCYGICLVQSHNDGEGTGLRVERHGPIRATTWLSFAGNSLDKHHIRAAWETA